MNVETALLTGAFFLQVVWFLLLGASLHEVTHYLVARPWTSTHSISSTLDRVPIPNYVKFEKPFEVPDSVVRAAGIAPVVWVACALFFLWFTVKQPSQQNLFVTSFFLGASILSPHDLIAFWKPQVWKEMMATDRLYSTRETYRILRGSASPSSAL